LVDHADSHGQAGRGRGAIRCIPAKKAALPAMPMVPRKSGKTYAVFACLLRLETINKQT